MVNKDNHRFYDEMSPENLLSLAEKNGFISTPDINLILKNLGLSSKRTFDKARPQPIKILEVGAGAGRVIDGLLARLDSAVVFALERSPQFLNCLQDRFSANDRVKIIPGDISSADLPEVDLTLWLWAGISDFGPEEQPVILSRLATCTRRTLVIEIPAEGAETIAHDVKGQWHLFTTPNGVDYCGYVPTRKELMDYARRAKVLLSTYVEYYSLPNRRRELYFFNRPIDLALPTRAQ